MEFKTTEGITIYSANVIQSKLKFGKGRNDVTFAKAKVDGNRKWYTIDKSSRKDFADYAIRAQSGVLDGLPMTEYSGNVLEMNINLPKAKPAHSEPMKKKYPIKEFSELEIQKF